MSGAHFIGDVTGWAEETLGKHCAH